MCEAIAVLGYGTRITVHLQNSVEIILRINYVDCDSSYLTGTTINGRYKKIFISDIRCFELT